MRKLFYIAFFGLLLSLISCGNQPAWVIGKDNMEDILVDVYISESLTQNNSEMFNAPEKKEALYNSVLEKYGVTRQQFDTSLYWYGQNSEIFDKICDRVTERLKKERENLEISASEIRTFAMQGDTVDIWNGRSRYANLLPRIGNVITYETLADTSFKSKDMYELTFSVTGVSRNDSIHRSQAELIIRYSKDSTVALSKDISKNGNISLVLKTDSLVPQTITGRICVDVNSKSKNVMIDKIRLLKIRNRNNDGKIIPLDTTDSQNNSARQQVQGSDISSKRNSDLWKSPNSPAR